MSLWNMKKSSTALKMQGAQFFVIMEKLSLKKSPIKEKNKRAIWFFRIE